MSTVEITAPLLRIQSLRQALTRHGLHALIIPSSDPHLSEYLPRRWQGRQWASGFTGSVGTLVVTPDFAGLWVDSRYWVQAETELAGSGIVLMKIGGVQGSTHVEWLAQNLQRGHVVAVDGMTLAVTAVRALEQALQPAGVALRTDLDVLGEVWTHRPAPPSTITYAHLRAPVSRAQKLSELRQRLREHGAQWHLVCTLDDIAWITNLRGADVEYNPVFLAYLLVGQNEVTLFVEPNKVPVLLAMQLQSEGFTLAPYLEAAPRLAQLKDTTLLIDPKRTTWGMRQRVDASVKVVEALNPSTLAKSRKTPEEIAQIRQTMEYDGAALVEFLCALETSLENRERITELTIDERLTRCRAQRPGFVSLSFPTIAAFNANGAMPHYRATPASHAAIEGDGLLLIDSGGQYVTGTTDITRVIAVGEPSAEQKRDFTVVLKGMIALSMLKFPRGTRSPLLDTIARAPIWSAGADYGHGTGHGVGYFLNVHEGPHGIAPSLPPEPHTAMEPGMITSNEPGIYRPGQWGVRIENLILNTPDQTTELGEFLKFETLTLCPIDTRLIERSLMRVDELAWLNDYHDEVRRRVAPLVSGDTRRWLEARTAPIWLFEASPAKKTRKRPGKKSVAKKSVGQAPAKTAAKTSAKRSTGKKTKARTTRAKR